MRDVDPGLQPSYLDNSRASDLGQFISPEVVRVTEKKLETKTEHIEQLVVGHLRFGNAGLDAKKRAAGYVVHLCTMDNDRRFVDLALTRGHLEQIGDYVQHFLKGEKS